MIISIPPVTRQQSYKETPPGWERRIGSRLFAGVNKTSPNVKTKVIRKLTGFQDSRICVELLSGPKKRLWNMSDFLPVHRNTRIGTRFLGFGDSTSTTCKVAKSYRMQRSLGSQTSKQMGTRLKPMAL